MLVSGKCVWTGSLPETFGDEDDNVCTWINVRPTVKKTARTARQDDRVSTSRQFSAASDAKTTVSAQSARVDTTSPGTPLWLSGATSTSSSTGTPTSRSEAKLDLFAAEEKATSGSLSARRRAQNDAPNARGERKGVKAGSKESEWQRIISERDAPFGASQVNSHEAKHHNPLPHSRSSTASMWDSLEHFSKTNRNRLPLTTESGETPPANAYTSITTADAKDLPERRVAVTRTSSALLEDLRTKSSSLYGSPSSSVLKESASSSSVATVTREDPDELKPAPAIPVLPTGARLRVEILSTWGDPHYVGLNGIELFDQDGKCVSFRQPEKQVRACPASINDLEEYSDDPRVAMNLVDGVNFTCDDFHMWLAPFSRGEEHYIELEMNDKTSISMIRIWNYNKSRAHSYRGVRHARLLLYESAAASSARAQSPDTVIFEGEIAKALGFVNVDCIDQSCEVILFTTDEAILQAIEANDRTLMKYAQSNEEDRESCAIVANVRSSMEMQRPRTSDKGNSGGSERHESYRDFVSQENNDDLTRVGKDGRPMTAAVRSHPGVRKSVESWLPLDGEPQQRSPVLEKVSETRDEDEEEEGQDDDTHVRGRRITIKLLSTWGDANYIGLTQLDVLVGRQGTRFTLDLSHIDATPRDLASVRVLHAGWHSFEYAARID